MCSCGTSSSSPPSSSSGYSAPVSGPVSCGGVFSSAIQFVDELGIPMSGASVNVTIGATTTTETADGSGTVCFTVPPGTSISVKLDDGHELNPGDSTTTPSGH